MEISKETVKRLILAGYKGAKIGLSPDELSDFVDKTLPCLASHS